MTLLMPILILIKWPYCLLLIDYLKVSPYLFPKLMSAKKMFFSPLKHDPIVDGYRNTAPHHHYSSSTHMDSQTLPTHSVFLFFSPSLDYLRYGTLLLSLHPVRSREH